DIDEIDGFLDVDISTDIEDGYHDSEGDIIYLESLLNNDTIPYLPLKIMVKVFDPGIHEKNFSPTYDCPDYEDSRAHGFVHRPLDLQSIACLYMGIRYPRSY
ncbi:hypothetical protein Tco_1412625, partial [Tanacetum coccineum]